MSTSYPSVEWQHQTQSFTGLWYSETQEMPPLQLQTIDDTISAPKAIKLARQNIGLIYSGDYQNGRELLRAMVRRLDRPQREGAEKKLTQPAEIFAQHRLTQGVRAQILGKILIVLWPGYKIELRRGQEVTQACQEVLGEICVPIVMPFKQLLAMISAHEWRKKKVSIALLGEDVTPHFGVFSPVRHEYIALVLQAPLPKKYVTAFDIGTGTGVLSLALAKRGVSTILASDIDPRAVRCAAENIQSWHLESTITVQVADLFPEGRADVIVCNPPWLPGQPSSSIEGGIFDPKSQFLQLFLQGLKQHLYQDGLAWLIISDLAEHLELRSRQDLLRWIADAGLEVLDTLETSARHPKVYDQSDPLYFARSKEVTSLWVLKVA